MAKRLLHRLQFGDLLVDFFHAALGDGADARAIAALVVAQLQQFFDFLEREAEILGALDETDHADRVVRKFAVARLAPRRLWQQPAALVVSERLHVDAGLFCGGSDTHFSPRERARRFGVSRTVIFVVSGVSRTVIVVSGVSRTVIS